MVIVDPDHLWVRVAAPETDAGSVAVGDSLDDHGSWATEVDELKLTRFGAEDVPVRSLERGARHDQSLPCFSGLADPRGERAQPRGAVFVG